MSAFGPYVVVHVAVSVDGATTGFAPDIGRFYELARTWHEDVTLTGADTILAQEPALEAQPGPGPSDDGPLLAVVDSRHRVRAWRALRDAGYWSSVVALRSRLGWARGDDGAASVEELVLGDDRVDLGAALDALGKRGAKVVRVDSGGTLTGALLRSGLLDEISLLVHPCLSGSRGVESVERRWYGTGPPPSSTLSLAGAEAFDDGVVWLRYRC